MIVFLHFIMLFINLGDQVLTLTDIHNHIVPIWAPRWRMLGVHLGVDDHIMRIIEHDHPCNCLMSCSMILKHWLEQSPGATWSSLYDVLDKIHDDSAGLC